MGGSHHVLSLLESMSPLTHLLLPAVLKIEQLAAVEGDCRFAAHSNVQLQRRVLQLDLGIAELQRGALAGLGVLVAVGLLLVQVCHQRMGHLEPARVYNNTLKFNAE